MLVIGEDDRHRRSSRSHGGRARRHSNTGGGFKSKIGSTCPQVVVAVVVVVAMTIYVIVEVVAIIEVAVVMAIWTQLDRSIPEVVAKIKVVVAIK